MIVQIQAGDVRQPPTVVSQAQAAVIYSNGGEAIAVFMQQADGVTVSMYSAADSGFAKLLERLGFDKRRIPEIHHAEVPPPGKF